MFDGAKNKISNFYNNLKKQREKEKIKLEKKRKLDEKKELQNQKKEVQKEKLDKIRQEKKEILLIETGTLALLRPFQVVDFSSLEITSSTNVFHSLH